METKKIIKKIAFAEQQIKQGNNVEYWENDLLWLKNKLINRQKNKRANAKEYFKANGHHITANRRCFNIVYSQNVMRNYAKEKIMARKYRKKPVVIEALEWTGKNLKEVIEFTGWHESAKSRWTWMEYEKIVSEQGLKIFTLERSHMATIGDMIIKGVQGEFYPCKPDIFKATYELA